MEQTAMDMSKMLKALAEPKRLRIVEMLSCGELCACKILEAFHITQPTLSHDMRVLIDAGVVCARREGRWTYYRLCTHRLEEFYRRLGQVLCGGTDCPCHPPEG